MPAMEFAIWSRSLFRDLQCTTHRMAQFARVGRGLAALGALAALATLVQQWDTRREVQLLGTGTGTGAPPSRAPLL